MTIASGSGTHRKYTPESVDGSERYDCIWLVLIATIAHLTSTRVTGTRGRATSTIASTRARTILVGNLALLFSSKRFAPSFYSYYGVLVLTKTNWLSRGLDWLLPQCPYWGSIRIFGNTKSTLSNKKRVEWEKSSPYQSSPYRSLIWKTSYSFQSINRRSHTSQYVFPGLLNTQIKNYQLSVLNLMIFSFVDRDRGFNNRLEPKAESCSW